jgi:parallel beta-helix repeat protein
MTSDAGIYLWTCPNWTVTDNLVENTDSYGIHLHHGDNYLLTRNYVNIVDGEAINVDTSDNANVIDNHVTMAESEGYVVTTCENMTFAGNTADECWYGGSFDTSDNMVLEGNIFTNLIGEGLYINDMEDAIIRSNVISGDGQYGMNIDWLLTSIIENNDLTGFGIWFEPTRSYSYYNHTVVNNTVNGKDIYYALDPVGVDLTASDYSQFIVINGSHIDIHDGTFDYVTIPVLFILSDNCSVWEIDATNNLYGIYYERTDDGNVHNVTIDAGGMGYGIRVRLVNGFSLADSAISGCTINPRSGVLVVESDEVVVTNCEFSSNWGGISTGDTTNLLISDNTFADNVWYGISVWGSISYYVQVLNNEVYNSTYGIWTENPDNMTISMNTVMYTTIWAIQITGSASSDVNITLNEVMNNDDAIGIFNNGNSFVMNNTVMWNDGYGIYSDPIAPAEIYYNIIALNRFDNGLDETGGNYWDDGVSLGNWWDDYTPPGVYNVDGNTDDRYPMQFLPTEPIINQPQDIYYAEGSEDNEILWYAFDDSLGSWAVTIDGGAWASDAWNFDNVTVNIDGLAYGTHTVIVTVWDIHGNNVTDTVMVHVFDDTPPSISNVPNMVAFVGASDQVLSWEVFDLHPDTFTVVLDDEEFATGSWTEGTLDFNIDAIPEGEHVLIMQIRDLDGNMVYDTVLLNVILDEHNPVIDTPDDITYEEGETGNVITWNPSDDYPATFVISDESAVLVEGSWGGSRVVLNVDGLGVGTYRFQITVTDGSGNSAEDFVNVEVTAIVTEPPPPPPPLDLGMIGLVVAGIGIVAVVIIAIVVIRKKKAPY